MRPVLKSHEPVRKKELTNTIANLSKHIKQKKQQRRLKTHIKSDHQKSITVKIL
jgi:hypothetical protein